MDNSILSRRNKIRSDLKNNLFINLDKKINIEDVSKQKDQQQSSQDSIKGQEEEKDNQQQCKGSPQLQVYNKQDILNNYQIMDEVIGEGSFSVVKKCISLKDNNVYAVKITRNGEEEIIIQLKKSFSICKPLNHEFIIKSYQLFINEETENIYYVMEYCNYPSLTDLLKKQPHKRMSESNTQSIITMIVEAILYLHSKGVCHRDIKPDNILVKEDLSDIKIIDFGVSKKYLQFSERKEGVKKIDMWTRTGTLHYKAPEMFQSVQYSESVDMWAVGILTFELLCGSLPFQSEYQMDTIDLIRHVDYKFHPEEIWHEISFKAKDFVKRLLKANSSQRLTPKEALMHPWLTELQNTQEKLIQNEIPHQVVDDQDIQFNSKQYSEQDMIQTPIVCNIGKTSSLLGTIKKKKSIIKQENFLAEQKNSPPSIEQLKQYGSELNHQNIHTIKKGENNNQLKKFNLQINKYFSMKDTIIDQDEENLSSQKQPLSSDSQQADAYNFEQ